MMEILPTPRPEDISASVVKPGGLVGTPGEYPCYWRPASSCERCRPSAYVRTFCAMYPRSSPFCGERGNERVRPSGCFQMACLLILTNSKPASLSILFAVRIGIGLPTAHPHPV